MNSKAILINLTNAHIPLDIFSEINSTRISKICNASVLSCIHLAKNTKDRKCLLVLLAQLGQKTERFVDKVTTQIVSISIYIQNNVFACWIRKFTQFLSCDRKQLSIYRLFVQNSLQSLKIYELFVVYTVLYIDNIPYYEIYNWV